MRRALGVAAILGGLCLATAAHAADYTGKLSLGYVYLDEEGDRSVNQPTFNTYEGVALSLRQFRWNAGNGMYVFGDLKNITLNNRNARAGIARPGQFNLDLHTRQYRRIYNADGTNNTQRSVTGGSAWIQPHRNFRVYGNYDQTYRRGSTVELYDISGLPNVNSVDYNNSYYRAGVLISDRQRALELDFKGNSFDDRTDGSTTDFTTRRYRIAGRAPLPQHERLWLNAGFERYERNRKTGDSLATNVGWGGLRYNFAEGWAARYSFIWDRTRATTEPAATDNIVNSFAAEKNWPRLGGLSVGYRYLLRDDVADEFKGNGIFVAGWLTPAPRWLFRADYGMTSWDDKQQTSLTGDDERTRFGLSATFHDTPGDLRLKYENRTRKRDDIGSKIDFERIGIDLTLVQKRYGRLTAGYSYIKGDYTDAVNTDSSSFKFTDHLIDGQIESATWHGVGVLFGGSYIRSKQYLDVERFTIRAGGRFTFAKRYTLEAIYSAHNFDDFNDGTTSLYSKYYTANIVEVNLITELGIQ